jgi:hypothetical protein
MNRQYATAAIVLAVALALGQLCCISCGGQARRSASGAGGGTAGNAADASAADAQAGGGAIARGGACGSQPVPKEHRVVAQACPTARGSSGSIDMTACTNRAGITCTKDADCTAGMNGRCMAHNEPCDTACSYDECLTDSDCPEGPCLCRSGGADTLSNQCLPGGNCKKDADCGNCGYCSPSAVPEGFDCRVAALTYTCHTATDKCTDRGNCDGGYCAYDTAAARWACGSCVPIPHP